MRKIIKNSLENSHRAVVEESSKKFPRKQPSSRSRRRGKRHRSVRRVGGGGVVDGMGGGRLAISRSLSGNFVLRKRWGKQTIKGGILLCLLHHFRVVEHVLGRAQWVNEVNQGDEERYKM